MPRVTGPQHEEVSGQRRRWPLVLLVAALLVLGLRAALPIVAERQLESVLSAALAARLQIGDVDLGLREGRIILKDVELDAAETGAELAGARRIDLDADLEALLGGSLVAESLEVEEPRVLFRLDSEGRSNWAGVGSRARLQGEPEEERKPAAAFRIQVVRLELGAGSVVLLDETAGGLPDVRIAVGGILFQDAELARPEPGDPLVWGIGAADASDWGLGITPAGADALDFELAASAGPLASDGWMPLRLQLRREGDSDVQLEGRLRPSPLQVEASLSWERLRLLALESLLLVEARALGGLSKGALEIALTLDDVPERGLVMRGSVALEDVLLELEGDRSIHLEVPRADGWLTELRVPIPAQPVEPPAPKLIHWARVTIRDPVLQVTVDGVANPAPASEPPAEKPSRGPPGWDMRVDSLTLGGGRAGWRTAKDGGDFETTASSIALDARGLRWPDLAIASAKLRVGGLGADPVRANASWGGGRGDLKLRARQVDLVPWNPILDKFSDYSVQRGEFTLDATLTARGERFDAPIDLVFHHLKARDEAGTFQKTFGVSLAAAIPLLTDPAGNIHLTVPVTGTLSQGAEFELASVITAALREATTNALVSAVSKPLTWTGSIVRRMGELKALGIGEAGFTPGDASLSGEARAMLRSAAVITRRSGARLAVFPEVSDTDLQALGISERGSRGAASGVQALKRAVMRKRRILDAETRQKAEPLAAERAEVVVNYLLKECHLPSDRIIRQAWKGKVVEGKPRVLLRLAVLSK